MKIYTSINDVKEAVKRGETVNWCNGLYIVKIDFEGDFIIKCTDTYAQELLTDLHKPTNFFTK